MTEPAAHTSGAASLPRLLQRVLLASLVFLVAILAPRGWALSGNSPSSDVPPWLPHFVVKTILLLASLLLCSLARGGPSRLGLRRPPSGWPWKRVFGHGILLGALTTALILATPAAGMPWLRDELGGLAGMILWIWLYSSFTEEVFVRGWFQSTLQPWRALQSPGSSPRWSLASLVSGLFFGLMHLSILSRGADPWTVAIIVPMTTLLGLAAAAYSERLESLWPAVLVHVAFNVGATLASVAFVLVRIAAGEPLPQPF